MTLREIDKLEGRELDAAVAEHVFGWTDVCEYQRTPARRDMMGRPQRSHRSTRFIVPRWATNIADAWRLVEAMRERGWGFHLFHFANQESLWYAQFDTFRGESELGGNATSATAIEAPLAISRAALLALTPEAGAREEGERDE